MINDVIVTPLDIISTPNGDVLHGMKNNSKGFVSFGELYFSEIKPKSVKAWKRHHEMTLNLVVPVGKIKFVIFDDREESNNSFQEIIISKNRFSEDSKNDIFICFISTNGTSKNECILTLPAITSAMSDVTFVTIS